MTSSKSEVDDFLNVPLAPLFGKLDEDALKSLDPDLKVAIVVALNAIEKLKPNARSWRDVQSAFLQTGVLAGEEPQIHADHLVKHDQDWFKFDGSPSASIVGEVTSLSSTSPYHLANFGAKGPSMVQRSRSE